MMTTRYRTHRTARGTNAMPTTRVGTAGHRGPERIAYSTDSLVYYTPDHHKTFKQPYQEEPWQP